MVQFENEELRRRILLDLDGLVIASSSWNPNRRWVKTEGYDLNLMYLGQPRADGLLQMLDEVYKMTYHFAPRPVPEGMTLGAETDLVAAKLASTFPELPLAVRERLKLRYLHDNR